MRNSTVTQINRIPPMLLNFRKALLCIHLGPCYTDITISHLQHNSHATSSYSQEHGSFLKEKF